MTLQRDIAPGVHRIADAYVNWYLITDDDGVTVVDAGTPPQWKALQAALSDLGRTREEVKALILTHAHYDHVGFARRLHREWGVPISLHEADFPLARRPALFKGERLPFSYFVRNPGFFKIAASFASRRAFFAPPVPDPRPMPADGAVLDVPGRPVAIHTPGHTDGHVAFHLPDRDVLIVGDALVTFDPYTLTEGPRLVAKAATNDVAAATRSLDAIEATGARILLPGHGEPWTGGAAEAARLARERGSL